MASALSRNLRALARTPAFTLIALVTMAVGIGGTTAISSVANATLLKPLPYPEPERLFAVARIGDFAPNPNQDLATFFMLRERFSSCEGLGARRPRPGINLSTSGRAEYVTSTAVTSGYFETFGLPPVYGRSFARGDEQIGGPDIAIITHDLAARTFPNPAEAVGQTLRLGGRPHEVVGVLAGSFVAFPQADVWTPLRQRPQGTGFNFRVACRLRAGVTQAQAEAELDTLRPSFFALFEGTPAGREVSSQRLALITYQELVTGNRRPIIFLLLVAVGVVLLVACANTACLFSARAVDRRPEVAIRSALGAGRWRIASHVLGESVLLGLVGGAAGVLLSLWSVPALVSFVPETAGWQAEIDRGVLALALGLSILAGVLFGLAPALRFARLDPAEALQTSGHRTATTRDAVWVRRLMVFSEVTLCMMLLVTSSLLIRSVAKLQRVELGFDPRSVLTAEMSLDDATYRATAPVTALYDQVLEQLRRRPEVEAAAIVTNIPIDQGLNLPIVPPEPIPGVPVGIADWRYITPEYFEALRIPLLRGRRLNESDRQSAPPVALVNEEFVRRYFRNGQALGSHIDLYRVAPAKNERAREIVGVVGNTLQQGLRRAPPPTVYVPVGQLSDPMFSLFHSLPVNWVVRHRGADARLATAIAEVLRSVDPDLPLSRVRTMEEVVDSALAEPRLQAILVSIFAGVTLLMAITGLAGSVLYSVMRRTREIGVRLALGANVSTVLRSLVRENLFATLAGIVAGIACAFAVRGLLQPFLFGITTADPVSYVWAALILMTVATTASVVAALRLLRIDPVTALRYE